MSAAVGALARPRAPQPTARLVALLTLAAVLGAGVAVRPVLVVPAILFGAFAAATVVAPELATLLVVFLLFANVPGVAIQAHGAPVVIGAVVPLLLVVPLIAHLLRGEKLVANKAFVLLVVLLLAELASTLISREQDVAVDKIRTFLFEAVLLYVLVLNVIRTPEMLRRVLWVVLGAGTFLSLVTIFQEVTRTYFSFYGGFALPDPSFYIGKAESNRASGPVGDPNYFGQVLLVAECVGLVFAWRARTALVRLVTLGATATITYAILLTYSRGTFLALFFVLAVMAAMRYFKAYQMAFMVLALVVVFASVPAFSERLLSIGAVSSAGAEAGADPEADQSAQGRSTEMKAAVNVFLDHPALGVGPGAFPRYYQEYAVQIGGEIHDSVNSGAAKGQEAERQAHNMVLSQAAELGLIGLAAFLGVIVATLRALVRTRRRLLGEGRHDLADLATILLLACMAYLTCGLFLTLAFERYFWLLLAIAGAATTLALRTPRPHVQG